MFGSKPSSLLVVLTCGIAHAGNSNRRGRLSTVDLLIKVSNFFNIKNSWSKLLRKRISTLPSLPLQLKFLGSYFHLLAQGGLPCGGGIENFGRSFWISAVNSQQTATKSTSPDSSQVRWLQPGFFAIKLFPSSLPSTVGSCLLWQILDQVGKAF